MDIFISINCVIIIITFLMNGFTITIFSVEKKLLDTVFNRVLLSLAVCDLISGILIAVDVHEHLTPSLRDLTSDSAIMLRVTTDIFSTALVDCAVLHLLGIAIDRYIGLFYALRYTEIVTEYLSKVFIASAWLICAVLALVPMTWLHHLMDGMSEEEEIWISRYDAWYSMFSIVVFMFTPLVSFFVLFLRMFFEIRRLLLNTPQMSRRSINYFSDQFKTCKMFTAMLLTFAILSVPFYTTRLINDLANLQYVYMAVHPLTYQISYLLKNLSYVSNPSLYIVCNREFRKAAMKTFRGWRRHLTYALEDARVVRQQSISLRRPVTQNQDHDFTKDTKVNIKITLDPVVENARGVSL